jgi:8-oxo-dGTP pyrophosphatase MutT (NUDIX family)
MRAMERSPGLATLAAALARHTPGVAEGVPDAHKAAVAAVLRETAAGADLLFIRRAEHPRDPWSGHMGLPGGRVDAGDATPLAAAIRETREEIGLDLESDARPLGRLSEVHTHLGTGALPRSVVPFGFALAGEPAFTLNHEVQEALWVPLGFLLDPAHRESMDYVYRGAPIRLPCYRYEGRTIWGLTLWIVDELLELAGSAQ